MDHYAAIAAERRRLATLFADLDDDQLATQSLCGAWTVKDVIGHLVVPLVVPTTGAVLEIVKARGSFDRANVAMARRQAQRPLADLLADLTAYAGSRFHPPGLDSHAPLTDVLVHSMDIAVPLELDLDRDPAAWAPVLSFLTGPQARRGFVRKGLPELRWRATDTDWSSGSGEEVSGPAAALALALLARPALLDQLDGPGVASVRAWQRWPAA